MSKPRKSLTNQNNIDPHKKKTKQGQGRNSRPSHGRELLLD